MRKEFKDMTIAELALTRGQIQGYLDVAIAEARRGGSTWAGIASSLGVSPQEAHRRYHWVEKTSNPGDGA